MPSGFTSKFGSVYGAGAVVLYLVFSRSVHAKLREFRAGVIAPVACTVSGDSWRDFRPEPIGTQAEGGGQSMPSHQLSPSSPVIAFQFSAAVCGSCLAQAHFPALLFCESPILLVAPVVLVRSSSGSSLSSWCSITFNSFCMNTPS